MTRGATLYDRRGMPLALPKGTRTNPSLRFGPERTGLYRLGIGALGLASHVPATGHVTPLSLVRANATTAGDEETRFEFVEVAAPVARMAAYRQAANQYGFKWYGRDASGLHASPIMTLTGTKRAGINTVTPASTLQVVTDYEGGGIYVSAPATLAKAIHLGSDPSGIGTSYSMFGQAGSAVGSWLGAANDLTIYTAGATTGRVILGSHNTTKLILDAANIGLQFMHAGTELARVNNQGQWLFNHVTTPLSKSYGFAVKSAEDGIILSAPDNSSTFSPVITFANHHILASANRQAVIGLALAGSHNILGSTPGELTIGTKGGALAGRVTLATNNAIRQTIETNGNVWFGGHAPHRFGIKQFTDSTPGGGLRLTAGYTDIVYSEWIMDTSAHVRQYVGGAGGAALLAMTIRNDGNTWFGAHVPHRFGIKQIAEGVGGGLRLTAVNSDSSFSEWWLDNSGYIRWMTGSGTRMTMRQDGNVWWGPHPDHRFAIKQYTDSAIGGGLRLTASYTDNVFSEWVMDTGGHVRQYASGPTGAGLLAMTVRYDGNMWFGNHAPHRFGIKQFVDDQPGGGLRLTSLVNDNAWSELYVAASGDLRIMRTGNITQFVVGDNAVFPNHHGQMHLGRSSNGWASIWLAADIAQKPGTNTWQVTSDTRTKIASSIRDYVAGLTTILALRPRQYRTNGLAGTHKMAPDATPLIGFVADEAEVVAPEVVSVMRMRLQPDDAEESDVKLVDTHAVTFMLINAIRELHTRITTLETAS